MAKRSKNPLNNTTLTIGGMVAAMSTLLYTGLVRGKGWKTTHLGAGAALIGLSLWHASQQAKYARLANNRTSKPAEKSPRPSARRKMGARQPGTQ